jgi:hypothetical protein
MAASFGDVARVYQVLTEIGSPVPRKPEPGKRIKPWSRQLYVDSFDAIDARTPDAGSARVSKKPIKQVSLAAASGTATLVPPLADAKPISKSEDVPRAVVRK